MVFPSTINCGTSSSKSRGFNVTTMSLPSFRRRISLRRLFPLLLRLSIYEKFGAREKPSRLNFDSLAFKALEFNRIPHLLILRRCSNVQRHSKLVSRVSWKRCAESPEVQTFR